MTTNAVHLCTLKCDGCGADFLHADARDATFIRILAAQEGWKYNSWPAGGKGPNRTGRKVFDACPTCEIPEVAP